MEIAAPTRTDAEVTQNWLTGSFTTKAIGTPVLTTSTVGVIGDPPATELDIEAPFDERFHEPAPVEIQGPNSVPHVPPATSQEAAFESTSPIPGVAVAELDGGFDDSFDDFEEDDFDDDFDDDFEEEVEGEYELQDDEYGNEFGEFGEGPIGDFDDDDDDSDSSESDSEEKD